MERKQDRRSADGAMYSVEHITERHLVRVGACPVLEVVVVYPAVTVGGDEGRMARPDRCYREAAEAFAAWALEAPAAAARAEFEAMGVGAAYRFDRRYLTCRFEAALETEGHRTVTVTRTVTAGRRRAGETARYTERWHWRLSDGTVRRRENAT